MRFLRFFATVDQMSLSLITTLCACCLCKMVIDLNKHIIKKVKFLKCCGAPVCCGIFPRRNCQLCKKPTEVEFERKTGFPFVYALGLTWENWFKCVCEYTTIARTPKFREFVESYQFPLQWHNYLRLTELFHQYLFLQYLFLRPASLQLTTMFRMRMCMHKRLSNASVFGQPCHKITQMLALCRANGVRVIHPRPIHAHFGIAFLCATRISTEFERQTLKDGKVTVCSNTYWRTMIPWIIRWITRLKTE